MDLEKLSDEDLVDELNTLSKMEGSSEGYEEGTGHEFPKELSMIEEITSEILSRMSK